LEIRLPLRSKALGVLLVLRVKLFEEGGVFAVEERFVGHALVIHFFSKKMG
jgi:hypothetical protein